MASVPNEAYELPDPAPQNDGKTVAAWATNGGITLGFLIGGVGVAISEHLWTWVGVGVALVSLAVGAVLRALGLGQKI